MNADTNVEIEDRAAGVLAHAFGAVRGTNGIRTATALAAAPLKGAEEPLLMLYAFGERRHAERVVYFAGLCGVRPAVAWFALAKMMYPTRFAAGDFSEHRPKGRRADIDFEIRRADQLFRRWLRDAALVFLAVHENIPPTSGEIQNPAKWHAVPESRSRRWPELALPVPGAERFHTRRVHTGFALPTDHTLPAALPEDPAMNAQMTPVPPSAMDVYREAARKRNDVTRKSRELQAQIAALEPLHERHAAAKALFDRITAEEGAAIAEWARAGGQGDAPRSDPKALEKAAKALAEAERSINAAGVAKAELENELMAVNGSIHQVQAEVRHTQAVVLGDEWLTRNEAYAQACAQLDAERMHLEVLFQSMHECNHGVATHYENLARGRELERFNRQPTNPQAEGVAAFHRWCTETFKEEGIDGAAIGHSA